MNWKSKLFFIGILILLTGFLGIYYVAPKGICKKPINTNYSQPDDFGMRYDPIYAISDDSLELSGDFIYPFNTESGDKPPNNTLIVIHPHKANSTISYRYIKPFSDFPLNLVTFDSRGIDKSEGDYFTFGVQESKDVSSIIDRVVELYPDMRFGIYALMDSGNVALKAMEQDKRIEYGIIEHAFETTNEYLYHYSNYDFGLSLPYISDIIKNRSLAYLNITENEVKIHPEKIDQPILLLDVDTNTPFMSKLYNTIHSKTKFYTNLSKAKFEGHYYPDFDDLYYQCLYEFIQNYALLES